jgi:hypothetical protein
MIFDGPAHVFHASHESLPPDREAGERWIDPKVQAVPLYSGEMREKLEGGQSAYTQEFIEHVRACYRAGHSLANIALAHSLSAHSMAKYRPKDCPVRKHPPKKARALDAPPTPVFPGKLRPKANGPICADFVEWMKEQLAAGYTIAELARAHHVKPGTITALLCQVYVSNTDRPRPTREALENEVCSPFDNPVPEPVAEFDPVYEVETAPASGGTRLREPYVANWTDRLSKGFTPCPSELLPKRKPYRPRTIKRLNEV